MRRRPPLRVEGLLLSIQRSIPSHRRGRGSPHRSIASLGPWYWSFLVDMPLARRCAIAARPADPRHGLRMPLVMEEARYIDTSATGCTLGSVYTLCDLPSRPLSSSPRGDPLSPLPPYTGARRYEGCCVVTTRVLVLVCTTLPSDRSGDVLRPRESRFSSATCGGASTSEVTVLGTPAGGSANT